MRVILMCDEFFQKCLAWLLNSTFQPLSSGMKCQVSINNCYKEHILIRPLSVQWLRFICAIYYS